jgi:alkyl sulfatase BDS1-like metallo-beta-lactamase superfamily hydrolase
MTELDWTDRSDFEDAGRGLIASLADPIVRNADGGQVWDCSRYDFMTGDCPPTANQFPIVIP